MDEFKHLANILKKAFPEYQVSVRRVKMPDGDLGDCGKKGKKFFIRIDKNSKLPVQLLILVHEFSHILAWDDPNDHGGKWGRAYAKVYNIYVNEYINEGNEEST